MSLVQSLSKMLVFYHRRLPFNARKVAFFAIVSLVSLTVISFIYVTDATSNTYVVGIMHIGNVTSSGKTSISTTTKPTPFLSNTTTATTTKTEVQLPTSIVTTAKPIQIQITPKTTTNPNQIQSTTETTTTIKPTHIQVQSSTATATTKPTEFQISSSTTTKQIQIQSTTETTKNTKSIESQNQITTETTSKPIEIQNATQTTTTTTTNVILTQTLMYAENNTAERSKINNVDGVWHRVQNLKVVAFSAYYDDRMSNNTAEVKVIAQLHCQSAAKFFCKLFFTHNLSATVEANVKMINSGCGLIYEAHFITCPIPQHLLNLYPTSLQLFANANESIGLVKVVPHLVISYPPPINKEIHKLAICVGRMVNFSDWLQLSFFVEFYKLIGATKFVFYTRSLTNDVEIILKYYEQLGLVDLIPFPLVPNLDDSDVESGTYYNLQLLQINDCHYWLRGKAKYAANIDADEFIVPNGNESLVDLLVQNDVQSDWDGFLFKSRYYRQHWPQLLSLNQSDFVLNSFVNLSKVVYPHSTGCGFDYRTKSINKPNNVVRVSVHGLHQSLKPDPLVKQIDLDQAVIVHLQKLNPTETPLKNDNLSDAFMCAFAADNVPSENPFAKYFDKIVNGIKSTIQAALL